MLEKKGRDFMNIKQDYSYLFSGFQNSKNSNNLFYGINLADYASIKNGSYGKLMKSYYKEMNSNQTTSGNKNEVNNSSTNKTETTVDSVKKQELVDLQKSANELKNSSDKLLKKGAASLFKTEYKESDKEALYKAVSDFVGDYNNVLEKGSASTSGSVARMSGRLQDTANDHKQALEAIGVTIDKGKMVINKDTFMNADMNQVKALFNADNSFGEFVSDRVKNIENAIETEAKKNKIDVESLKKEAQVSSVDKNTGTNTDSSTNKTESTVNDVRKQEMTNMQKYGDELQNAANKLLKKETESLFKDEYTDEDKEALHNAVSDFVTRFNTVLEKGKESTSDSIVGMAGRLKDTADDYKDMLKQIGISVEEKKLTFDKDSFMNADMNQVKKLFNETNSFGYFVSQRAESIENAAKNEANRNNLYSENGTYNNVSAGTLYTGSV